MKYNKLEYNKPTELPKPEVFSDAIYGYIYINYDFLKKLIDTSPMQRLRRIKQLSFVHMVFSSAEQSRFNHSLGVYELARRFLEINNNIFLKDENAFFNFHRNKMLLLTSALLHDIGHGSYSHTFEIIFGTNHEKQSAQIILEHNEIKNILDLIDPHFRKDVASIINKKGKFKLIEQLLSSQLDFDRLDYLRRDAFFTGVSYGYIDSDLLIRSMEINTKEQKIVFKKSSITSIENYLINRHHMYCRVYYHTKVIGFSVIVEQIFKRVKFLFKENKYKFKCSNIIGILKNFVNNKDDIYNYLNIDDFYINFLIFSLKQNEEDDILVNLCNDFFNRKIWKYLDINEENKQEIQKIKNHYAKNEIDYYTCDNKEITSIIYKENKIKDNILIYKDVQHQKITNLSEESHIINLLSEKKQLQKKDLKFFYRKYKNESK